MTLTYGSHAPVLISIFGSPTAHLTRTCIFPPPLCACACYSARMFLGVHTSIKASISLSMRVSMHAICCTDDIVSRYFCLRFLCRSCHVKFSFSLLLLCSCVRVQLSVRVELLRVFVCLCLKMRSRPCISGCSVSCVLCPLRRVGAFELERAQYALFV